MVYGLDSKFLTFIASNISLMKIMESIFLLKRLQNNTNSITDSAFSVNSSFFSQYCLTYFPLQVRYSGPTFSLLFFQLPIVNGQDNGIEFVLDVGCKLTGLNCGSNMTFITAEHYKFRPNLSTNLLANKICMQQCMHISLQAMKITETRAIKLTTTISLPNTARIVNNHYVICFSFFEIYNNL